MRVVVPTPRKSSPAVYALQEEGLKLEIGLCDGDFDYGRHLTRWWLDGTGFVLVEWDIAPWPGAVQAMWECEHDYCAHWCAMDHGLACWLNCVKFSAELTRKYPEMPDKWRWAEQPWNGLGGSVCLPVREIAGGVHEHHPPVAHVRGLRKEPLEVALMRWER